MPVPYKLNYFEIETGIDSTSTFIHTGDLTATKVKKYLATSNDILLGDGTTASLSGKQNTITLTTTGTSGASTLIGATLNIPNYADGGVLSLSAIGGTSNANAATITGTVLNLQPANASFGGVVTTLAQTFAGDKTLTGNSNFINNDSGNPAVRFKNQNGSGITAQWITSTNTVGGTIFNNGLISTTPQGDLYGSAIGSFNSFQLASSLTDETGTGSAVFSASPTFTGVPIFGSSISNGTYTYTLPSETGTLAIVGGSGVGTVTSVSALTLGTTGTDLSSTVANSTTTPVITLNVPTASAANRGALSSADWTTFDNKQIAGNYITSLTGEATASGPGAAAITLTNSAVIAKVLTGLNVTGGTVIAADTILAAFGKVQNQINGLIGGSIFQGVWNASTNTPALVSSVGTNGYYYIVSVAGSTNLDGITDWQVGDWAIFAGTSWQKVDNTDSVSSVNGFTGAVSLTTDNITEGATNLYFTNTRARTAISLTTTGSSGASTYDNTTGVFNIPTYTDAFVGTVTSVGLSSATSGVTIASTPITTSGTITIAIATATASQNGLLSSTDWTTFNSKQDTITLTTTGTSGAATFSANTLNIPQYADSFVGTVTSVAAITLGTTGTDLSSTVANGTTTPVITLQVPTASATNRGALSSGDWTTFNSKQDALSGTGIVKSTAGVISYLTDPLPIANGGTGSSTQNFVDLTTDQTIAGFKTFSSTIKLTNGTSNGFSLESGTTGFYSSLKAPTGLAADIIVTLPSATGTLALTSDIHSAVTLAAIGATANANGATLTGQVLNLQPADASFGGVVTTGTQTFAGAKTFTSALSGTSATFSLASTGSGAVLSVGNVGSGVFGGLAITDGGTYPMKIWGSELQFLTGSSAFGSASTRLTIATTGAATFSSSVAATSATFSGAINIGGDQTFTGVVGTTRYIITNETNAGTGSLALQAGGGSAAYGGSLTMFAHSHATKAGYVVAGISSGSGGKFTVNDQGIGGGAELFTIASTGAATFSSSVTSNVNDGSAGFNSQPTTTTNSAYNQFLNADGYGYIGKNSSAGGNLATGSAAYALVVSTYKSGGTTAPIQFAPNNSVAMTITTGGSVGIGTTNPYGLASSLVAIVGSGSTYNFLNIQDTVNANNAAFIQFINSAGSGIGGVTRVGTTNAVVFNTTSDRRLKKNIIPAKQLALPIINQIEIDEFDWETGDRFEPFGVIAQDLHKIFPNAVTIPRNEEDS